MVFELTGFVKVNDLSGRDFLANFKLVPERIGNDCVSLAALVVLFVALGASTLVAEAGGLRRTSGVRGAAGASGRGVGSGLLRQRCTSSGK